MKTELAVFVGCAVLLAVQLDTKEVQASFSASQEEKQIQQLCIAQREVRFCKTVLSLWEEAGEDWSEKGETADGQSLQQEEAGVGSADKGNAYQNPAETELPYDNSNLFLQGRQDTAAVENEQGALPSCVYPVDLSDSHTGGEEQQAIPPSGLSDQGDGKVTVFLKLQGSALREKESTAFLEKAMLEYAMSGIRIAVTAYFRETGRLEAVGEIRTGSDGMAEAVLDSGVCYYLFLREAGSGKPYCLDLGETDPGSQMQLLLYAGAVLEEREAHERKLLEVMREAVQIRPGLTLEDRNGLQETEISSIFDEIQTFSESVLSEEIPTAQSETVSWEIPEGEQSGNGLPQEMLRLTGWLLGALTLFLLGSAFFVYRYSKQENNEQG